MAEEEPTVNGEAVEEVEEEEAVKGGSGYSLMTDSWATMVKVRPSTIFISNQKTPVEAPPDLRFSTVLLSSHLYMK